MSHDLKFICLKHVSSLVQNLSPNIECALSNSSEHLVQLTVTSSGHVVTSHVKLSEFDKLEGAFGFAFEQ